MSELLSKIERLIEAGVSKGDTFDILDCSDRPHYMVSWLPLGGRGSMIWVNKKTGEITAHFKCYLSWFECRTDEDRRISEERIRSEVDKAIRALDRSEAIARFFKKLWPFGGRS
ncbi:MAG: hypothetical protein CMJ75_18920 [Planctomycetaceae bacterium]|nr:hypothetical protein [Planctomycetaceae bacterium]